MRLLAWVWAAVDSDPFTHMGEAPTASFIRKWLGRIQGAPPAELAVKCEGDLVPAGEAPCMAQSPIYQRLRGEIPKAEQLLLQRFGGPSWSRLKFGGFTKSVAICSSMLTERGAVAEAPATTQLALK